MKLKKNLTRRVFGAFIFAASLAGVCAPSLAQQANPVQVKSSQGDYHDQYRNREDVHQGCSGR